MNIEIVGTGSFTTLQELKGGDTFVFAKEDISKEKLKVKCKKITSHREPRAGWSYLDSDEIAFYVAPPDSKVYVVNTKIEGWN